MYIHIHTHTRTQERKSISICVKWVDDVIRFNNCLIGRFICLSFPWCHVTVMNAVEIFCVYFCKNVTKIIIIMRYWFETDDEMSLLHKKTQRKKKIEEYTWFFIKIFQLFSSTYSCKKSCQKIKKKYELTSSHERTTTLVILLAWHVSVHVCVCLLPFSLISLLTTCENQTKCFRN